MNWLSFQSGIQGRGKEKVGKYGERFYKALDTIRKDFQKTLGFRILKNYSRLIRNLATLYYVWDVA